MTVANFIIAGTEKAGTTSVYSYLAQHPDVAVSRRKETNFFRRDGTLEEYAAYFPRAAGQAVVAEASPAYLGEAETVVPRMQALVPDVRLLFILREPVSRLLSSYHFHRGHMDLPPDLNFHEFVEESLKYVGGSGAVRGDIDEWYLKVLAFGRYHLYLQRYFEAFGRDRIKVALHEELSADPLGLLEELSGFLGIDSSFWADEADLRPHNVTFSGRSRIVHQLALAMNDRLEPLLRPRPQLKNFVVGMYKRLNCAREGYGDMTHQDRLALEAFYAPHNARLETLLERPLPAGWPVERDAGVAGLGNRCAERGWAS